MVKPFFFFVFVQKPNTYYKIQFKLHFNNKIKLFLCKPWRMMNFSMVLTFFENVKHSRLIMLLYFEFIFIKHIKVYASSTFVCMPGRMMKTCFVSFFS